MPSKIKAKPLRISDEMWANVAKVSAEVGKREHPTVVMLLEEALCARGLGSPAFVKIAAGLQEAATVAPRKPAKPDVVNPIAGEPLRAGSLVPLVGTFERKPMQKTKGPRKW